MPATALIPLAEQVAAVKSSRELSFIVRDFLDRFRHAPEMSAIEQEPPLLRHVLNDEGVADAYLASLAATLAHEQGVPAPAWARGSSRALDKPFFAAKTPKLKAVLLQESPVEFRIRNIFVSANALSRA